jgi:hypothetical protein
MPAMPKPSATHPYHTHWVPFRSLSHPFTSVACSPPAAHNFCVPCGLPQLRACHVFFTRHRKQKNTPGPCVSLLLPVAPAKGRGLPIQHCGRRTQSPSYRPSLRRLLIGTHAAHASLSRRLAGQGHASFGRRRYYLLPTHRSYLSPRYFLKDPYVIAFLPDHHMGTKQTKTITRHPPD